MTTTVQVAVATDFPELEPQAQALAARLGAPRLGSQSTPEFILHLTPDGLALSRPESRTKPLVISYDTAHFRQRLRQPAREDIVRAVGVKGDYRPSVIDATAGTGQDACVLAHAGCSVTMIERSPIIAVMLADALRQQPDGLSITLLHGDAKALLMTLPTADVVYLDPMYPDSGKQAAKRKAMQFFRALVGDDSDADELLAVALTVARRRVVVKRPHKAPPLANRRPSAQLTGRTTRFDLYITS
jgi:16S rRNA (guanine1516-N2)-methyltransferase